MTSLLEAIGTTENFEWLLRYGVVLLRVIGLFAFAPILGSRVVPVRVRMLLATVLAAVLLPLVPLSWTPEITTLAWVGVAVRELSVGFVLGLAARLLVAACEAASSLIATQSGYAIASMVDPSSGDPTVIPATFHSLLTTTLFLAADLHHVFIRAVVDSYTTLPAGTAFPAFQELGRFGGILGARLFAVAVQLAAPALFLTMAADLVLVLVGKAMPQVPILLVGYPLKMAVGLVGMALLSLSIAQSLAPIVRTISSDASLLMRALATS